MLCILQFDTRIIPRRYYNSQSTYQSWHFWYFKKSCHTTASINSCLKQLLNRKSGVVSGTLRDILYFCLLNSELNGCFFICILARSRALFSAVIIFIFMPLIFFTIYHYIFLYCHLVLPFSTRHVIIYIIII